MMKLQCDNYYNHDWIYHWYKSDVKSQCLKNNYSKCQVKSLKCFFNSSSDTKNVKFYTLNNSTNDYDKKSFNAQTKTCSDKQKCKIQKKFINENCKKTYTILITSAHSQYT